MKGQQLQYEATLISGALNTYISLSRDASHKMCSSIVSYNCFRKSAGDPYKRQERRFVLDNKHFNNFLSQNSTTNKTFTYTACKIFSKSRFNCK